MKYIRKPEIVEAIRYTGDKQEIKNFCPRSYVSLIEGEDSKLVIPSYHLRDDGKEILTRLFHIEKGDFLIKWSDLTYEAMPETKFNKLYNIYST